jgi:hypothetical protein
MAAETGLKLNVTQAGAAQTAAELQKVADAQAGVTAQVDASVKPAEEAADAKVELFQRERDWMGVLRQISPEVAGFIDGVVKAARVTKELGEQKKFLSSIGAAAIPVFIAIAATVRAMAAEFAEANKAIRDQAKALDELKSKERERQQSIEDTRAASKLPIFTPDEARVARETAGRIGQKFPFIDEGAVNRAVGFAGGAAGEVGGGAFGLDQIARLARLIQLGPESLTLTEKMSPAAVQREITSELDRHRGRLDQEFATKATQSAEGKGRAIGEVAQMGGSTLNLRERLQRRAPEGMDIDHLIELAQKVQDMGGLDKLDRMLQMAISGESPSLHVLRRLRQTGGLVGADLGFLDPTSAATESEITVLRGVFAEMTAELRRIASPTRIDARQYNPKNYGESADVAKERTRNGDTLARDLER